MCQLHSKQPSWAAAALPDAPPSLACALGRCGCWYPKKAANCWVSLGTDQGGTPCLAFSEVALATETTTAQTGGHEYTPIFSCWFFFLSRSNRKPGIWENEAVAGLTHPEWPWEASREADRIWGHSKPPQVQPHLQATCKQSLLTLLGGTGCLLTYKAGLFKAKLN